MRELVTNWRAEESVRGTQTKYLTEQIEQFNRDFQHPVVLCCTLHGAPNSEAHALLETGRPLPIPAPPRPPPSAPTLEPDGIGLGDVGESPTTAVLYWLPAVVDASKLDPPVERYYVQQASTFTLTLMPSNSLSPSPSPSFQGLLAYAECAHVRPVSLLRPRSDRNLTEI